VIINYRILNIIPWNKYTQTNYASRRLIIAMLVVFSGDFYATLDVLNCRLFGLSLFQLGLTAYELRQFIVFRLVSTCLLQNLPQIVLQITALNFAQKGTATDIDGTVYLAFCLSFLSMMATLLGVWMQRTNYYQLKTFELVIKLNFSNQVTPSAKEMVESKIRQNRGRYQAIIQPLAHYYDDLTSNQVTVGSVDVAGNTITIYGNIIKLDSSNVEKNKSPEEKGKICQAVLLQGFKLEKELKGYMQSSHPKVTLKGSHFKILNEPTDETSSNGEKETVDFDRVQSISANHRSPSMNSVELIETRGP